MTNTTRLLAGLAGIAMLGFVGCGGDGSPSGPGVSLDDAAGVSTSAGGVRASNTTAPPVSADEACPAGLALEANLGVAACVHSTDFVGNCLTPDMLEGKSELVMKMGFLNSGGPLLYNKPALYHTRKGTCSPVLEYPGQASHNVTGFPIAAGNNGIGTWTLPLSSDTCGTYTFLDTVRNGEGVVFMPMSYTINTGKDCDLQCRDLDLQLDGVETGIHKSGGHKVEFTASWKGDGATAVLYKNTVKLKSVATSNVSPLVKTFRYAPALFSGGVNARLEVTKGSLTCSVDLEVGGLGGRSK